MKIINYDNFPTNTFFAVLMMYSFFSMAADNLQFKGRLVIPNCIVNNNKSVEVDFGDVEIQTLININTPYHGRDFHVPLNCPYTIGVPKLKISSSMPYNSASAILRTSKHPLNGSVAEGLVVFLRKGGGSDALKLNTYLDVSGLITGTTNSKKITLYAALGRVNSMAALTPGPFTSSASIVLKYE